MSEMLPREQSPFMSLVGGKVESVEEGRVVMTITLEDRHMNPNGVLHAVLGLGGFEQLHCGRTRRILILRRDAVLELYANDIRARGQSLRKQLRTQARCENEATARPDCAIGFLHDLQRTLTGIETLILIG